MSEPEFICPISQLCAIPEGERKTYVTDFLLGYYYLEGNELVITTPTKCCLLAEYPDIITYEQGTMPSSESCKSNQKR